MRLTKWLLPTRGPLCGKAALECNVLMFPMYKGTFAPQLASWLAKSAIIKDILPCLWHTKADGSAYGLESPVLPVTAIFSTE